MGARRMRFTKGEREAFTAGRGVEVLNVSRWLPARVVSGVVETDSLGCQYVEIEVTGGGHEGHRWCGYAKAVRLVERVGAYV
jgi:hypothetical protein